MLDLFSDIDAQEHREDDRLNEAEQQAQHVHDDRKTDRQQMPHLLGDHLLAVEVAVKSKRERERAHDLLNEVERQHQEKRL